MAGMSDANVEEDDAGEVIAVFEADAGEAVDGIEATPGILPPVRPRSVLSAFLAL